MAESYSVKARLSAIDSGFTSTIGKATSALSNMFTGVMQGVGQRAFSALSNGISNMVGEIDSSNAAWKTFASNMTIVGKSTSEIESVTKELQSFAEQTVYSSSDMATTFAQLEAVGVKNTTSLVKGFGGLAAAAENPQQAMKTLSTQATQMAAKPSVAWADFKLMLEQTPAGIAAVAKEMDMSTSELVKNVQDGKVSTDAFFKAIEKAGTSDAFTKLATQPKTVAQAIDGLKESIANKLLPAFDVLSQAGIDAVGKLADSLGGIDADKLAESVSSAIDTLVEFGKILKTSFSGVGEDVGSALKAVGSALAGTNGEFTKTDAMKLFKQVCDDVAGAIKTVAGFIEEHADTIAKLIGMFAKALPWVLQLSLAFKGFSIIKSLVPGLTSFAGSLLQMAGKGIAGLAAKLFGVAAGEKATGEAAQSSAKDVLAMGAAVLMISAGVLLIAVGFALLAQSAIALTAAGWPAVAVMAGLAIGVVALMIGMMAFTKTLAPMAPQMMQVSVAFIALGAAVTLISLGFALLAQSAIALAAAGWPAIAVMVGLIAVIALLAIGAAALAPALTAGAVGFIAFGAGLLLIGVAAVLAAASMAILSTCLPVLVQYGLQASVSILALGAALSVFGASALMAAAGLLALMAAVAVTGVALMAFGMYGIVASVGLLLMAAALTAVQSSMSSIAQNATKAKNALDSMQASVSIVEAGLKGLGQLAESAMDGVASAFKGAAKDARSAGQEVANGFTDGMKTIVVMAPAIALIGAQAAAEALRTGESGAYESGQFISIGFANGMLSMLGRIQSAANQIVKEANRAIEAKAKIGSPSKITTQYGEWYGQGYVNGIDGMARDAWKAAENLVSLPALSTPDIANTYDGSISSDYAYYRNAEYVIQVPLTIDGREYARATAHYNEAELNRRNLRENRKHGIV